MTTSNQPPRVRRQRPDPAMWDTLPMRQALGTQDITNVYRLLSQLGFSQQHIAALTGQSQPEVSAIIHGRKVMAYDVLSKICDGLGAPRGYAGMSRCPHPEHDTPHSDPILGKDGPAEPGPAAAAQ